MQFSTDTELSNGEIVDIEDFEAESLDELNAKLKEIWRSPNGVYGKIFYIELNANLFIGDECFLLPIYKYSVKNTDKTSDKWVIEKWSEMFDAINGNRVVITEDDLWEYFGFHIPRSENVVNWAEYLLLSPNCPERILGKWLAESEDEYFGEEDENEAEFGNLLIGNILNFGKKHGKLNEMFNWLKSKNAEKFLLSDDAYKFAAKLIISQIKLLKNEDLNSFAEKYNRAVGNELILNEPL